MPCAVCIALHGQQASKCMKMFCDGYVALLMRFIVKFAEL